LKYQVEKASSASPESMKQKNSLSRIIQTNKARSGRIRGEMVSRRSSGFPSSRD
jgi:hypothetical protein